MNDKRNSCTVYIDKIINRVKYQKEIDITINDQIELLTEGNIHKYIYPLLYSQSKPKDGIYTLSKIPIVDIDVHIKGIANRKFFEFDPYQDVHLSNLKDSFYETDPIILEEMNGIYYSIDGHHRITVAIELGLQNILAFVIKVDKLTHPRK